MTYPMRISLCTSTIETAVYENRTHGGVRGRELVTPSYSIAARKGDLNPKGRVREVRASFGGSNRTRSKSTEKGGAGRAEDKIHRWPKE